MKDFLLVSSCLVFLIGVGWIIFNIYRTQTAMLRKQEIELNEEKIFLKFLEERHLDQDQVDGYEQQLFDDAAQFFFAQNLAIRDSHEAATLQAEVLKKMPSKTRSEIRKIDAFEWSIRWGYYGQLLEYCVRCDGIFYVHIDRLGHEFKQKTDWLAAII